MTQNSRAAASIRALPWSLLEQAELQALFVLVFFMESELAETLRFVEKHGYGSLLKHVADRKLGVSNLTFGDHNGFIGDHTDFLHHQMVEVGLNEKVPIEFITTGTRYLEAVRTLPPEVRAQSVIWRERNPVFYPALEAIGFLKVPLPPELQALRYFIARDHELRLESIPKPDPLAEFVVDDSVMGYCRALYDLLTSIPRFKDAKTWP